MLTLTHSTEQISRWKPMTLSVKMFSWFRDIISFVSVTSANCDAIFGVSTWGHVVTETTYSYTILKSWSFNLWPFWPFNPLSWPFTLIKQHWQLLYFTAGVRNRCFWHLSWYFSLYFIFFDSSIQNKNILLKGSAFIADLNLIGFIVMYYISTLCKNEK